VSECLFCRIASGELSADVVHESAEVMGFRDINPAAPVHVLLIPKRHIDSAAELTAADAALLAEVFEAAAEIARAEGLSGGYRVVTNVGPDAGQSVAHLHVHVLGGRALEWPPG
jgi:histidine triad (HIT) family protein